LSRLARFLVPGTLYGILACLVLVPLVMIAAASIMSAPPFSGTPFVWTLDNYAQLWSAEIGLATLDTLIVSVAGTAIALTIGATLAWLAARSDIPGRSWVFLAGITPLFISVLVAATAWSALASGRTGYFNLLLASIGVPWHINVESLGGIALLFGLYYAPYPFIFIYGALSLIHPEMEEAAAIAGAPIAKVLRRITFPLVKPALLGSMVLVFALMIEDFPVPDIVGAPAGIETLSVAVYNLMTRVPTHQNAAGALSVVLMAIICTFVLLQRKLLAGTDYRTVTGKGMQYRQTPLGAFRLPALAAVSIYALLAVGAPTFALLEGAFRTNVYFANVGALFSPVGLSTAPIVAAITDPAVVAGAVNSVEAGAGAAIAGAILFFALGYVVHRTDFPGRRQLEYLAMLPLAVPALVLGIGILWTWLAAPVPVYGTITILSIAYLTRFFPQGYRAVASSIAQIHEDLENAARVAGANRFQTIRRITLPLVRGSVFSSAFLMLVLSIRELTASLFLYTTATRTLAIVIYEKYITGSWAAVASISLIFTASLALITLAGRRWLQARI
jgi:iron(III) transport system permease protein